MLAAPSGWQGMWGQRGTDLEVRLTVGSDAYGNENIAASSLKVTHYLYDSYGIGNACFARLRATLLDPEPIADGAVRCTLECRLTNGQAATPWVPQGTFFLNTAERDWDTNSVRIEAFDGLALFDVPFPASSFQAWPQSGQSVVRVACEAAGITRPSDEGGYGSVVVPELEDGLTCREVIASVAAVSGGNFTMARDGRLRYVELGDLGTTQASYVSSQASVTHTSGTKLVSGVSLSDDSETHERGTGPLKLSAWCAWASDEAASAALYAVRGKRYVGIKACGALLSPLLELGDTVSLGGTSDTMLLDSYSVTYDQGLWGDASAPLRDEVEQRIGYRDAAARRAARLAAATAAVSGEVEQMSTAEYVSQMISRMNARANRTGGYTYITEGQGIRTYDVAVSDPLVGAEATSVTEVRGGTVRIANGRDGNGEWEWLTVFESGHIASQLVTAVNVVAGFIGSPGGNYWNLDTGELRMAASAKVGDQTLEQYVGDVASGAGLSQQKAFNALTDNGRLPGLFMQDGQLYINANYLKAGIITDNAGKNYWDLSSGDFSLSPAVVDIGGVNLAEDSRHMTTWRRTGAFSLADGVASCPAQSTASWSHFLRTPNEIAWSSVRGRKATVSFDMRTSGAWGAVEDANAVYVRFGLYASDGTLRRSRTAQVKSAPTQSWTRVAVTLEMVERAFATVNSSGAYVYLAVTIYNRSRKRLDVRHVKVERGNKPTDWSLAPADVAQEATDTAVSKANTALARAKGYTDTMTQEAVTSVSSLRTRIQALENGLTSKQKTAIDAYFSATKTMKQLTNNGQVKGIWLKNGKLYISGTAIETGSLSANVVRAGIIASQAAWDYYKSHGKKFGDNTYFNVTSGYLQATGAKLKDSVITGSSSVRGTFQTGDSGSHNIVLRTGTLYGKQGSTVVGRIDSTADVVDVRTGAIRKGLNLVGRGVIRLISPIISVLNSSDSSRTSVQAYTGRVSLRKLTFGMNSAMTRCSSGDVTLEFINGLLVSYSKARGM